MSILLTLATLTLRKAVTVAAGRLGAPEAAAAVNRFLVERYTDHSQRLVTALQTANEQAWKALEIALAGDSIWERCKVLTARTEDRAFAQQVRAFLDSAPLPENAGGAGFRQKCQAELRAARQAGVLAGGTLDPRQLAEEVGDFARFTDPQALLDAEWRAVRSMAAEADRAGYHNLARLLSRRPEGEAPLLVTGSRFFFRRAVEEDPKLFQGLAFARLESFGEAQEKGFAALADALGQHGDQVEEMLGDVMAVVVETHDAVLDVRAQLQGQSGQIQQIGQAVLQLLEQHQLQSREVRPEDSLSIRNDHEREMVKQLVSRYRALPEEARQRFPSLLNAVGKLEVVAGDFATAQKDFRTAAALSPDLREKAEAHHNAYRAALEQRDWAAAFKGFMEAVKLDARRFAPFPVGKYQPLRILGAGGFGVAFLCRHRYMKADVVVKTLFAEGLGRGAEAVFSEAQMLRELDHPAIIRILECGYASSSARERPYLITDFFQGRTLEEEIREEGTMTLTDLLGVLRPVAEALQAAHAKGILHRDVKPANVLVRKDAAGWRVRLIDFGLAMRRLDGKGGRDTHTATRSKTLVGQSIAGTADFAPPEQMGRLDDPVGPYSDVYGWAKTFCSALFGTTQPLRCHWNQVPDRVADLMERCLAEDPKSRPQSFKEVLETLDAAMNAASTNERPAPVKTLAVRPPGEVRARPTQRRKSEVGPVLSRQIRFRILASAVAFVILAGALLTGFVLRVKTRVGTLVVEVDQPGVEVFVDGDRCTIYRSGDLEAIRVEAGEGRCDLKITKGGFQTFAREFTVKAGAKQTIKVHLEPEPRVETTPGMPTPLSGLEEIRTLRGLPLYTHAVAISLDGKRIIAGQGQADQGTVFLWDAETWKALGPLKGHQATVLGVAFAPDGAKILSASEDKTIRIWDAASRQELSCLHGHTGPVISVSFSPDGKLGLSGSKDGTMRLWDLEKATEVRTFRVSTPDRGLNSVAFFPDGKRALSNSLDMTIRVWDLQTGQELFRLRGQEAIAERVVLSNDGKQVLMGGVDGVMRLWDVENNEVLRRFTRQGGAVIGIAFSPDGHYIASGGQDKTVRLWDRLTGEEVLRGTGHTDMVRSVVFSADGNKLVSGGWDNLVKVWRVPR